VNGDKMVSSLGYGQIAALTSAAAQGLPSIPENARKAVIVASEPIRIREDGTEPAAAGAGLPVTASTPVELLAPLASVRLIAQSVDAVVDVGYYT
jgi:hypothetical protein